MAVATMSAPKEVAAKRWLAPAKLNLCLYVVGKREDGYHQLETLFQLLDVGDELSFDLNDDGQIARDYDFNIPEQVDLCLRAAQLLKKTTATHQGVTIKMDKKLPAGGGLGGGSSDAATVLLALNQLWGTQLDIDQLATLGLSLGADVPVFVRGRSAWGSGIGELLTPVDLPEHRWLVVTPDVLVSTARIFSDIRLTARPQMKKIRALKMGLSQNHFDFAAAENQLEPIARAVFPEVNALFEWFELRHRAGECGPARLSGSGGTVYAQLNTEGESILGQLPANTTGFVANGVNIHPVHTNFSAGWQDSA